MPQVSPRVIDVKLDGPGPGGPVSEGDEGDPEVCCVLELLQT